MKANETLVYYDYSQDVEIIHISATNVATNGYFEVKIGGGVYYHCPLNKAVEAVAERILYPSVNRKEVINKWIGKTIDSIRAEYPRIGYCSDHESYKYYKK